MRVAQLVRQVNPGPGEPEPGKHLRRFKPAIRDKFSGGQRRHPGRQLTGPGKPVPAGPDGPVIGAAEQAGDGTGRRDFPG